MPDSRTRFSKARPCPVCNGHPALPQGQGRRCFGYLDATGQYARCTREELAGDIEANDDSTYSHRLTGDCRCGRTHGATGLHERRTGPRTASPAEKPGGLTLAQLAAAKGLPVEHLASLGWTDSRWQETPAVLIPYRSATGRLAKRYRVRLTGDRFRWEPGAKAAELLYGLDRVALARELGYVVIAEGETDCAAAWLRGIPAVGLPGKAMWSRAHADALAGIPDVYLWQEPDARELAERVRADLPNVRVLHAPAGFKDLCEANQFLGDRLSVWLDRLRTAVASPAESARGGKADMQTRSGSGLVLVNLAEVERREVGWLWYGWLARGALTVITGHPDVGKSWLTLALAAAITRGWKLYGDDTDRPPRKVLWLNAEDTLEYTIGPRLDSLGADSTMVDAIKGTRQAGGPEDFFNLGRDLNLMDAVLAPGEYAMVVIDPLNAYFGAGIDTHRDAAVRSVLGPLAALAERRDVAVVAVIHPTKGARDLPLYRIQGSVANNAAARTALLVGRDEASDGEKSPRRHVTLLKNNLMADEDKPPSLCFELSREHGFRWVGVSSATADGLLGGLGGDPDGGRSAMEEAIELLRELLADGPMDSKVAMQRLRGAGCAEITVKRARKALGVEAVARRSEESGKVEGWSWKLPGIGPEDQASDLDPLDAGTEFSGPVAANTKGQGINGSSPGAQDRTDDPLVPGTDPLGRMAI